MMQIEHKALLPAKDFAYWLQGFVELNGSTPNEAQWKKIKEHLAMVFDHVNFVPMMTPVGVDAATTNIRPKTWAEIVGSDSIGLC